MSVTSGHFTLTPVLLFEVQVKQIPLKTPLKSYGFSTTGILHSLPPDPSNPISSSFPTIQGKVLHSNSLLSGNRETGIATLHISGLAQLSTGEFLNYTISGKMGICKSMVGITSGAGIGNAVPPVKFGEVKSALNVHFELGDAGGKSVDGGPQREGSGLRVLEENAFVAATSMGCGNVEGEFTMVVEVAMVGLQESKWSCMDYPRCKGLTSV